MKVNTVVSFCTASNTFPTNSSKISGAIPLTVWKATYTIWFPSNNVSALDTPPVRSATLTPVKVFVTCIPSNDSHVRKMCYASTAPSVKAGRPKSSPITRRYQFAMLPALPPFEFAIGITRHSLENHE
jgi:hypothetical protein